MNAPLARGLGFLLLWLAVAGPRPSDLPVGVAVAAAAAWTSLILAPPAGARLNLSAALSFLIEFLSGSLSAGLDVARRALARTPDLEPGMLEVRLALAPGFARNAFCIIANLMPGTLLTGFDPDDAHKAWVHGLDVRQPIAADLAAEEAAFLRTLGHD
ncbi:multicomponent Na+:H+ antiporter subunit E [Roseiarcus fermentans]|uniref:Multicomponent Na+:H+ antiporter subunit E n=1 Tax=Roseiarcus fermentans TaxID=1473586 RepID=A0A366FBD9_9HYPH|nr:Na+/H+ antiporter subunit E [Roseiarcus fermentans]RBP11994.1 multicomponent Na+:H+ antiporter subunit E [Roseiarcus fermentans]